MKTGILIMNTGTADEPTIEAVRRYLGEFLMDPYILGMPTPFRRMLVKHICKHRPERTVHSYEEFWTPEGSPFMIASYKQRDRLAVELAAVVAQPTQVALGMRYGNPSIASALEELRDGGCERVILLPLYPQQVRVCAGTCFVKAEEELAKLTAQGWKPQVIKIPYFYEQDQYCEALAQSVRDAWEYKPGSKLIVSFHSTMMKDIAKGDPYVAQTRKTAVRLARDLDVPFEDLRVSYQSRFDARSWLQPFTEPTVLQLADEGVSDLCIVCPGFTADNIETAIEVDRDLRAAYLERAPQGAIFTKVPALNASSGLIKALASVVADAIAACDERSTASA